MSAALELARQGVEASRRRRRSAAASASARSRRRLATNIVRDALVVQRLGGQLGRLAGAEDHHAALAQVAERVARAASTATEATLAAADGDRGLRAHALAGGQRGAEQRLVIGPVVPAPSASSYARLTWPWTSASPTIIDSRPPRRGTGGARRRSCAASRCRPAARSGGSPALAREQPQHERLGLDRVADDEVELGAVAGGERDRLVRCSGCPRARAGTPRRAPSGSATRSRSATGAVLCEMPRASSSLIAAPASARSALARSVARAPRAPPARRSRARCGRACAAMIAT